MKNFLLLCFFTLLVSLNACYYDSEEDLYPNTNCVTDNVTYSGVIAPIIQSKCYTCHDAANNLGNINLEGYTNLKKYVDSGQLLGAIRHESGYSPMPQNSGQLPACEIAKIEAWVADGAPE